jgi:hypothetical protein
MRYAVYIDIENEDDLALDDLKEALSWSVHELLKKRESERLIFRKPTFNIEAYVVPPRLDFETGDQY